MISREDFKRGIKDAVEDFADPGSEYAKFVKDVREVAVDLAEHDPMLSALFHRLVDTGEEIAAHIRQRGEK